MFNLENVRNRSVNEKICFFFIVVGFRVFGFIKGVKVEYFIERFFWCRKLS